ncbi:alpha/beta hydrolase [Amycolatopsis sp. WAC 01375]|uniref:alpha/beta fold hydrolase n=1 Tax=unclassified Amycolatopsis TaxID=2618356 RepID=UPI0003845389|nr:MULTISPECIES: alpha/beta hydrolase [unclassified Amycolatopsis]AGE12649.1 Hyd [Amycolatopsis sp. WAC 01375]QKN67396.1 alpha/beta hydrolase [Streptomyces coelicolor]RSM78108.1 alpha/beta hydrolase [Amycolatopsis sp. WAC 01375]RSN28664.1 alpha/beta hydrolase [Amycolatopsis sp. WAC 01416]
MLMTTENGIRLSYNDCGDGPPVLLLTGTGAPSSVWDLHQVPALRAAGFRVITMDNRGIKPSDDGTDGFTIEDLVSDVAALIDFLDAVPCRVIGTSMGSYIAQEVALAHPELLHSVVLMAACGKSSLVQRELAEGEAKLIEQGIELPPGFLAAVRAMHNLGPATLADDDLAGDWLDLFAASGSWGGPGVRAQLLLSALPDRLDAYRAIKVPCHVVSFEHDLVAPPAAGLELASAIPGSTYRTIPECGHFGYLENPEAVNRELIRFLRTESRETLGETA